ncbi:BTAD domain-containing putative transcriptional regulator [Streptomyces sp. NPDC003077]|uniref:BTAD domain-containing putative transcriptional regulator n=1 Tax=Streptomyces sp. NPDC003077 TaxID=3154443 RepID=UPI0033BF16CC
MEFRLLGTVAVETEGGTLPLGPAKRRSLLAALLLTPNKPVPVPALGRALWTEEPPVRARSVVQGHVSHLRAVFGGCGRAAYGVDLITHHGAYELRTPPARIDSVRFRDLVERARRHEEPREAVCLLRDALALWRGPALTGAAPGPLLLDAARALEEARIDAVERLAAAYGALGEHARAAAELQAEASAHPLRESLTAALVLALYRSGRQSEAMERFHLTRRLLDEELGVGPGRALTEAYEVVLRGERRAARNPEPGAASRRASAAVGGGPDGAGSREAGGASHGVAARGASVAGASVPGSSGGGPTASEAGARGAGRSPSAADGWSETGVATRPDSVGVGESGAAGTERLGMAVSARPGSAGVAGSGMTGPVLPGVAGSGPAPGPVLPGVAGSRPVPGTVLPGVAGSRPVPGTVLPGVAESEPAPGTVLPRVAESEPAPGTVLPEMTESEPAPGTVLPGVTESEPAPGTVLPEMTGSRPVGAGRLGSPAAERPVTVEPEHSRLAGSMRPVSVSVRRPAPAGDGVTAVGAERAHPTGCEQLVLPRPPGGFTGRTGQLAALRRAATGDAPLCLVTGPAGVGKTSLVVHWAHQQADAFPDGRLFANLRGFSPQGPAEPHLVLQEFLSALGVPTPRIPESLDTAAALYRRLTNDRRMAVILDDARSSAQVRPLLPAGPACVTVVTSRDRLPGLVVSEAARPIAVDVLDEGDSAALLGAVIGERRVAAEPVAAQRLARLCGGLPLALRVVAARLTYRPDTPLERMADEMTDERRRLALLSVEDQGPAAALEMSVRHIDPGARRMLHALAHHPGGLIDGYAAAALADASMDETLRALDALACAHLVTEVQDGRWSLHDLVRLYARQAAPQRVEAEPSASRRPREHADPAGQRRDGAGPQRDGAAPRRDGAGTHRDDAGTHRLADRLSVAAAEGAGLPPTAAEGAEAQGSGQAPAGKGPLRRVVDLLLRTALAATAAAEPEGQPCCSLPSDTWAPGEREEFGSRAAALEWYAEQRDLLARTVTAARAAGLHAQAWRLGILQWPWLVLRPRDGWVPLLSDTLDSVRRDPEGAGGDPESRVRALLGWVLTEQGELAEALTHLELAPTLATDLVSRATARINLAVAHADSGNPALARQECLRAHELAIRSGHVQTQRLALQHLSRIALDDHQPVQALDHARRGLALAHTPEATPGRVLLRVHAGEALLALGDTAEAVAEWEDAANEAEREGFDEGAARALALLSRTTGAEDHRRRHALATSRITASRGVTS